MPKFEEKESGFDQKYLKMQTLPVALFLLNCRTVEIVATAFNSSTVQPYYSFLLYIRYRLSSLPPIRSATRIIWMLFSNIQPTSEESTPFSSPF